MLQPELIGRYVVEEILGVGAFATVWLARDDELRTHVAIKVLAENMARRLDIRERFVGEAQALRRADSDRLVRVFDIGELSDGRPYFVMTYANQGSLEQRLQGRPLLPATVLGWGAQLARGIAVLHAIDVIHRDVKPANVLFHTGQNGHERLLIADLGLAKDWAEASGFTDVAGSPGYMPPEQARPGGEIDKRSDVYAIGATLYRAFTGSVPNAAGRSVLPPSRFRPDLPPGTDEVLLRALAPEKDDRWATAEKLADRLDELAAAAGGVPGPALPKSSSPAPHRSRRHKVWIAVAVCAVVAAGCASALIALRPTSDTAQIADDTGRIRLAVPAAWAGQQQGHGWSPNVLGLSDAAEPGLAVSSDLAAYRVENSATPGVFIGLSSSGDLPARVLHVRHDGCTSAAERPYSAGLTGEIVRWDCPGQLRYTESGLSASGGVFVYVQIKESATEPDHTGDILGGLRIS